MTEIRNRFSGKVMFKSSTKTVKQLLEFKVQGGAYLRCVDLRGAYLRGADLSADLRGAYLRVKTPPSES